ncbi:MAG: cation transporting ATPase C-terminal domain-containing protein, partial [Thaumarchaeota archaeon]|nr:cation transporting ATPase C-terminal domain-containing protein [Nitrososphaerota archaeon]
GDVLPLLITIPVVITPILLSLYFLEYDVNGAVRAMTIVFLTFIFMELAVALSCRSLRYPIIKAPPHKLLILAIAWETILIFTLISLEPVREAFKIVFPAASDLLLMLAFCVFVFVVCELVKILLVARVERSRKKASHISKPLPQLSR